jgi:hypothetical protein
VGIWPVFRAFFLIFSILKYEQNVNCPKKWPIGQLLPTFTNKTGQLKSPRNPKFEVANVPQIGKSAVQIVTNITDFRVSERLFCVSTYHNSLPFGKIIAPNYIGTPHRLLNINVTIKHFYHRPPYLK